MPDLAALDASLETLFAVLSCLLNVALLDGVSNFISLALADLIFPFVDKCCISASVLNAWPSDFNSLVNP